MNSIFNLVFLCTALNAVQCDESSADFDEDYHQEPINYYHHGFHAPNKRSWRMTWVWETMSKLADSMEWENTYKRSLSKILPGPMNASMLKVEESIRWMCESVHCDPNEQYRTVDGTCNNLQNTRWGSAPFPFERYLPADYGDDVLSFRTSQNGSELPGPRNISRILSNSTQRKTPKVTLMVMQWGQFMDHDITLTPEREHEEPVDGSKAIMCCEEGHYDKSKRLETDCVPIDVEGDPYYQQDNRQCLRFIRSMPTTKGCYFSPTKEQINQNTAFADGSMVYGSTDEVADFVRTKTRGLLKVSRTNLPPQGGDNFAKKCPINVTMERCNLAGDVRVDVYPGLTSMHIAFIRLHNIIAEGLYTINNHWDDEKLFQETRRIVSALIQQITYRDWLPYLLGPTLMNKYDLDTGTKGYKDTYNTNVNPTIRNVFATAAFRFGHTMVTDFVKAATEQMSLPLEGNFFNINVIESDGTGPSSLLKGMSRCPSGPVDGFVANTLTDKLFAHNNGDGRFFGLDIVSLNIQRGRDHGIPSYREWRQYCKLTDIKTFKDLKSVMEKDIAEEFSHVYNHIDDIDLFPAALSEFQIADGLLGPTFSCLLAKQFAQIKHGDRFWYEREHQPKPFTLEQLNSIRSQNLTSILCQVSEHTQYDFQPDPFLVSDHPGNNVLDCSNYQFINLQPWKDDQGDL